MALCPKASSVFLKEVARSMNPEIKEVLYSAEEIDSCVEEMAKKISEDYKGRKLIVVTVLKGACIFMCDLVRKLDLDVEIEFMIVSSYGSAAKSSGVVRVIKDLDQDIEGKDVLLVDDVLDSGLTLKYLQKNLQSRHPNSIEIAVLLKKELGVDTNVEPKYLGMTAPNEFIVGYGLDYAESYRNLPYVGILDPSVYSDGE